MPDISAQLLGASFGFLISMLLGVFFILIVLVIIPLCIIFKKAGRQWWEAIIPFYNIYVLTVITGQPWWIVFGIFFPVLQWLVSIFLYYHMCKRFGYGVPFTVGVILLPFIFLPIIAFGDAVYTAPEGASTPSETPSVK